MTVIFVARQPILNANLQIKAFELLYRNSEKNSFPNVDPNLATSQILLDSIIANAQHFFQDKEKYFINFTDKSLIYLIPTLFNPKQIIVEVLETCTPNDELFRAIRHLYNKGYTIALDDFIACDEWRRFYRYIKIIKIDIRETPLNQLSEFLADPKIKHIALLAEKVETHAEFVQAKELGFKYFQGYYFSNPEMIKRKVIKSQEITIFMLLSQLKKENFSFKKLEQIIANDVGLAYKLLKYVNQRYIKNCENPICSFKQALVFLGEDNIRKFISLMVTASAAKFEFQSFYLLSLERAYMCEYIAAEINSEFANEAFLVGLFSVLSVLLDNSLDEIVKELPISTRAKLALTENTGILGAILNMSIAYAQADWKQFEKIRQLINLPESKIKKAYTKAIDDCTDCLDIF